MKEMVMDVLATLLITAGLFLLSEGLRYFKEYTGKLLRERIEDAKKRGSELELKTFEAALRLIDNTVYNAVSAMEQTKARDLRGRVKKGLSDKTELEKLAREVLDNIKRTLAPDIRDHTYKYIDDLDEYIKAQIERTVLEIKSNSGFLVSEEAIPAPVIGYSKLIPESIRWTENEKSDIKMAAGPDEEKIMEES